MLVKPEHLGIQYQLQILAVQSLENKGLISQSVVDKFKELLIRKYEPELGKSKEKMKGEMSDTE